jgi:hypothetical protein
VFKSLVSRRLVAATAIVVVVAASVFVPNRADARVTGPRLDSLSKGCGQLQDAYDRAVLDLETAAKTGTQAQYDAALANLVSIIRQWNQSVCKDTFDSIHFMKNPPSKVTGVNGAGENPTLAPVTKPGSGSPGGKPISPVRPTKGRVSSVLKKK